jgi:hypothetical protein
VLLLQDLIKQAEAFLKQASQQPGYSIMVLKACQLPLPPAATNPSVANRPDVYLPLQLQ